MTTKSTKNPSSISLYKESEALQILSQHVGKLFGSKDYSDVTFNLKGKSIPAHKTILACRAFYFDALFSGGFKETKTDSIELPSNTPWDAFCLMLRYIYTGKIEFDGISEDVLLELLDLSDLYRIEDLEEWVQTYLIKSILNCDNVSKVLDFNEVYDSKHLHSACIKVIDNSPITFLKAPGLSLLSAYRFHEIISRDCLSVEELEVFLAAKTWIEANPNSKEEHDLVLSAIRFHHIPKNDLIKKVWHSKLVSSDMILKVFEDLQDDKVPPKRNLVIRNKNHKQYKR